MKNEKFCHPGLTDVNIHMIVFAERLNEDVVGVEKFTKNSNLKPETVQEFEKVLAEMRNFESLKIHDWNLMVEKFYEIKQRLFFDEFGMI